MGWRCRGMHSGSPQSQEVLRGAVWGLCPGTPCAWSSPPEMLLKYRWHVKWPPPSRKHPLHFPLPSYGALGLTTLGGNLCPGRYLTFSCCVLMTSVSFLPPTSSSNTHMVTRGSKRASWAALPPTILAMAEPLAGGGAQKVEERGRERRTVAGRGQCSPSGCHRSHWIIYLPPSLSPPPRDAASLLT